MKRKYFILQSDDLQALANDYCNDRLAAQQEREAFARRYGARCYLGTTFGIQGLFFDGDTPKGWVRRSAFPGLSTPDISCDEGIEAALEMLRIGPMPVAEALAKTLHFQPSIRMYPGGQAQTIGVERIDGKYYVSVPTPSAEDFEINPALGWRPVAGLMPVSEETYLAERQLAGVDGAGAAGIFSPGQLSGPHP